jgi:glycosyltransferase involved in cell wall biosynthesis
VTFFHSAGFSPDRKGTDLVIEAFARLKGAARLVVHSQVSLQKSLPQHFGLIEMLVQKQSLEVIEKSVPAPGLYHLGDVYVYPTRLEGIGLTIAEALACGLPSIVSDNPPMNEFVDKDCGVCVEVKRTFARADGYYWPQCLVSPEALLAAMQRYVDDIGRVPDLKRSARVHAENALDWKKNSSKLPEIFGSVRRRPQGEKSSAECSARIFDQRRTALTEKYPVLFHVRKLLRKIS